MFITMAIVNEIKCARCDRKYSGVRSRCPYCGARRIGRGKYSEDSDNAKGKMLISVLIMAVFTVGAAILLFTTPVEAEAQHPPEEPGINSPEDDINSEQGLHPEPSPDPTPTPTPIMRLDINSIHVTFGGSRWDNDSFALNSTNLQSASFNLVIEPPGFDRADDFSIVYESTNPEAFEVVEVPMGVAGVYGFKASWIGQGTGTLRITVTNNGTENVWTTTVYSGR